MVDNRAMPADPSDQVPNSQRHPMAEHVINQIGLHASEPGDECGPGLHLHLSPLVLEDDGHVDFGVLGVFLDMASSQVGSMSPFLHADISINRIARPTGTRLHSKVRALRAGKRTTIVHVEAIDDEGVRVADSTQQIVTMSPTPEMQAAMHDGDRDSMRRRFMAGFDGECRLDGRLHDIIGIERIDSDDGATWWTMPLGPPSRNGFGGLHGGVAFDFVTEAAVGSAANAGSIAQPVGALLRYLAPATGGPFRAVPAAMPQGDGATFVRVEVYDDGQDEPADGKLCIVGEVHLVAV